MLTLGPLEAAKRAVARNYETLEYAIFQQRYVEASQRKARDLEKSKAALRKELAEAKASSKEFKKRIKDVEYEAKGIRAKLESTSSKFEVVKGNVEELEAWKTELLDWLEGVAMEAVIQDMSQFMYEYLSGEHSSWNHRKWIMLGERLEDGLSLSIEEIEVEGGHEVSFKEITAYEIGGTDVERVEEVPMTGDTVAKVVEAATEESGPKQPMEVDHLSQPVDLVEPVERQED